MILRRSVVVQLLGLVVLPACAAAAQAPPVEAVVPAPLSRLDETIEFLRLKAAIEREVPRLVTQNEASDAAWVALARAELVIAGFMPDRPQLLVVVDRNPLVQQLVVMLASPQDTWRVVGGTKVSTGSTGRFDHYITPRGVFNITPAILGFRAEGTLNENGIRGLGSKGMRVWDFGWQVAAKGWNAGPGKPDRTPIRLMMHATDPDRLEGRIGHPASQGCIRIPTTLNRFLDRHGVLDVEYERAAVHDIRFRTLLPADRQPSGVAGNTLVVVDSAAKDKTAVASRAVP